VVCGFQCIPPNEVRSVASIAGTSHSQKPDNQTIELLFTGVTDLLKTNGFRGTDQPQPSGHHLTGGRIYGDGFVLGTNICCTVEIDRKSVTVYFYEWEFPAESGIFPATDEQRASVRALAGEIEAYLRARLPTTYEILVSTNRPDAIRCSPTNHQGVVSRSEGISPVGTFVGPADNPVMKVHLEQGGIYTAEDIGPPEFWVMMEGTTAYPQRIKFPPQRGRWSLDSQTGQLILKPETSASFRWSTAHFRYDKSNPNRLAWGDYAFLWRAKE
jgi:hypothetical protein